MITLQGIEKIIFTGNEPVHALKGITLNVAQGEIFGILGRKGAGKSALIRCINLLEPPSRGSVIIDSCNLNSLDNKSLREARRKIGMIFRHFNLLNSRTVFENVALPLELSGFSKARIEEKVYDLLNLTQIHHLAKQYPENLTAEQKQRIAITRSLATEPKILLCEEATADLDPKSQHAILNLLNQLNKKLNLTILFITHDMEVIKSVCHKVAILHEGEIVEQATTEDFFAKPQSLAAKEFVKGATRLELPSRIKRRLRSKPFENSHPLLRLSFIGQYSPELIMGQAIQNYGVSFSILQAHLESIATQNVGIMITEIVGSEESIENTRQFFEQNGLYSEVLAYVV